MSRIGNKEIKIPSNCKVQVKERDILVEGKLGKLSFTLPEAINVKIEDDMVRVSRENELKQTKAFHGLTRALINNMIIGVTEGFSKTLVLIWKGGKIEAKGNKFSMNVNFIKRELELPKELKIENIKVTEISIPGVDRNRLAGAIRISGIDKQLVGEYAAKIRDFLPPEPYHGKGIRYIDEKIALRQGKKNA